MSIGKRCVVTFITFGCWAQAPDADIVFADVSAASGIDFVHSADLTPEKHLTEAMGGGVAVFDFDNDGREDVFFVSPRRLYRNRGKWRFQDVTEQQGLIGGGYALGVATGDFDGDGRTDLYITGVGRNHLYRNTSSGFREVAMTVGVAASGWSAGAAFFDYDRDGRLDLFVARYLDWSFEKSRWCGEGEGAPRSYCHPRFFGAVSHLLFRNAGDGTFRDVSAATGIAAKKGKGLGVRIDDLDDDGWPDIVVANDSVAQQLFLNRGGVRFEEVGLKSGVAFDEDGDTYAGMGIDTADVDGDAVSDLFVNALARQGYWVYRQQDRGQFMPFSGQSGLTAITDMRSGWGARLADLDNDGWNDLIVAQGHVMDTIEWSDPAVKYREPLLLARNVFGRLFDVSGAAGPAFRMAQAGRGLATGDLDGDGLLDVVISNLNSRATVLRNVSPRRNFWLRVNAPIGSRVLVTTASGRKLRGYATTSGSYVSASSAVVHFGLGEDRARRVEVFGPTGVRTTRENLAPDTEWVLGR